MRETQFTPKFFSLLKGGISKEQLQKDIVAGLIVGIVALPLAIAFAIASGVSPDKGLITAIIAGLIISVSGRQPGTNRRTHRSIYCNCLCHSSGTWHAWPYHRHVHGWVYSDRNGIGTFWQPLKVHSLSAYCRFYKRHCCNYFLFADKRFFWTSHGKRTGRLY